MDTKTAFTKYQTYVAELIDSGYTIPEALLIFEIYLNELILKDLDNLVEDYIAPLMPIYLELTNLLLGTYVYLTPEDSEYQKVLNIQVISKIKTSKNKLKNFTSFVAKRAELYQKKNYLDSYNKYQQYIA